LLSIGDALYDSLNRNIDYTEDNYNYQETLKKMLGAKLNSIYRVYEGWDEFYLTSELPNDSRFGIRFGADYWEIERRHSYGCLKQEFHIERDSSSFSVTYPIMDGYSLSTLRGNVNGMVKKIKDTPISNLGEFLDKLSSDLLKESTHVSRDELDKNLNT
jgi:hypothetical protein